METQLVCPNCRAENMPGALICYRCNTKLAGAPSWVGPATFKTYDPAKDRGIGYMFSIFGGIVVAICYFLAWLGVPKGAEDAENRGTSAFDILFGTSGSKGAIGRGGVGEASAGIDVRLVLLVGLIAAFVAIAVSIIKPMFGPLLACGLIIIAAAVYFMVQLMVRNNAQFNTADLVSLLRLGFYGTIVAGIIICAVAFRYRNVPTFQSGTNVHKIN